ncbi:MAG TPA: aminotransferase class V-fold PLP-dependent enzyme [Candidatus Eisenbacteria bacterium]|nr:aminotransferase class V-fold PLP-dependent enzyme [Candidatus Eisenbacteria bacterium]
MLRATRSFATDAGATAPPAPASAPKLGRAAFALDPESVWFNGGANSPLPAAVADAVQQSLTRQLSPERLGGMDTIYAEPDSIRERLARVLGLPAEQIGLTHSSVNSVLLLAHALALDPGKRGRRILIGPDEFPADVYPWFALESLGFKCEHIGRSGHPLTPEDVAHALDAPGDVAVLALGVPHYVTGDIPPVPAFAERLKSTGAWLVVDASQSAGAVALDWAGLGADAIFFSGYKWLLGPYGTGAMWARNALIERLAPAGGNWWALEDAPDMDRIMARWPRNYLLHGRGMDGGQSAAYFDVPAWRAGLDTLLGFGVPAVEAHQRALQDAIVEAVRGSVWRVLTSLDRPRRSPLLLLEGGDAPATAQALARQHVYVSARNGRLRVTPGAWSEPADVDRFARALRAVSA